MDWFLYDNGLRHERVKSQNKYQLTQHGIMQEKEEVSEYQSRGHFPLKQTLKEKS